MRQSKTTQSVTTLDAAPLRSSSASMRWSWIQRIDGPALALLLGGLSLRLWLLFRGWPTLDSDEAIIGLMARHILYLGEHPTFYYGQHYMGSLEAYVAALFFWLLGPSQVALRLAMFVLMIPFLVCAYLLGRAAYGRMVGLLTLAALAFGPAFGLMREAPAIGGYQETLLFGALLALIAYARLRAPATAMRRARWPGIAQYAAFGLIAGLGVWSDELILVFIVAPLLALALARTRELFSLSALAALAIGFLVGAAPFIRFNVLSHGRTFVELRLQESAGHLTLGQLLSQIGSTLSIGIPATFGSPQVCVAPRAVYAGYISYPAASVRAVALSACQMTNNANMLFSLAILGVYGVAAWPLLQIGWREARRRLNTPNRADRGVHNASIASKSDALETPTLPRRTVRPGATDGADLERAARLWLRGMLILAALGTIAEYALSRRTVGPDQFVAVRYLLPLYITLPVVIGPLWEALAAEWKSVGSRSAGRSRLAWPRAGLAAGALALLFALFLAGGVQSVMTASDTSRFALPAISDQQVMARLQALGITAYYGDYWTCYNLVFVSGERLHCSSYPRYERYAPYAIYLSHVQHPAYLMLVGSVGDQTFQRSEAPTLYRMGYVREEVGGIALYYLPAPAR